jgi:rare lipoprotein A
MMRSWALAPIRFLLAVAIVLCFHVDWGREDGLGSGDFEKNVVLLRLKTEATSIAANGPSINSIESGAMEFLATAWKKMRSSLGALALAAACLSACASPSPSPEAMPTPAAMPVPPVVQEKLPYTEMGFASWYAGTRKHNRTASGEKMVNNDLTAAHRTLPMDTMVRVTNLSNGVSVLVRINDRGPFIAGRVIDLSPGAAAWLGMKVSGVAPVRIEVKDEDQRPKATQSAALF